MKKINNIFSKLKIEIFKLSILKEYKQFEIEILLLFISIIWVFISLFISENWFARSGSIMVLFSVIIEYRLLKAHNDMVNRKVQASVHTRRALKITVLEEHKKISFITHIFLVVGTLIWGYGDLIFLLFV